MSQGRRGGDGDGGPRLLALVMALLTAAPNGAVAGAANKAGLFARKPNTSRTSVQIVPPEIASPATFQSATLKPDFPLGGPALPAAGAPNDPQSATPAQIEAAAPPAVEAPANDRPVPPTPTQAPSDVVDWNEKFDGTSPLPAVDLGTGGASPDQVSAIPESRLKAPRTRSAALVKELKAVLGDGVPVAQWGLIQPFVFHSRQGPVRARGAGLEGFLFRKLELERRQGEEALAGQWDDYFAYLGTLFSAVSWAGEARAQLDSLRTAPGGFREKNAALNAFLIRTVRDWQKRLAQADPSSWGRQASIYMILARSYNRLKPGKNFFDSLDEEELKRIRQETRTNVLWLLDVFEIGEVGRWGSSGGSPYALKGYRFKKELGGEQGARRFIARAKKLGFRVGFDEIPNHTAIDSDQAERHPQDFIHILPPAQPAPGEDLAAYKKKLLPQVPQHIPGVFSPLYQLIKTKHYPGHEGRDFWILAHQPITDYGDAMWLDMLQRDYSRQSARDWEIGEMRRLFRRMGTSFARRDMAYYVLNTGYYERWLHILNRERDLAQGWARMELDLFIEGFKARWAERTGSEFLSEMTDGVRAVRPDAVFIDEIYAYETDVSRSGSNGFYNKNDHDVSLGQIGLYDALMEAAFRGDTGRLKAALDNVSFRAWQRGGASAVNFSVTHDGGEGNPVDKFGKFFRAVAAMTMLFRPTLVYNGLELGVGQRRMLIGDLSASQDLAKAIPFDVPAVIDWKSGDPSQQAYLRRVFEAGERNSDLFRKGAMQVLDAAEPTPIVAWAAARTDPATGRQKALVAAANFSSEEAWANFKLDRPLLEEFGAFQPRADRDYLFSDLANLDEKGQPRVYARSGRTLIEKGLTIGLPSAGAHIFEVEEVGLDTPTQEPPASVQEAAPPAQQSTTWNTWTTRLTQWSLAPYFFLQIPQVLTNFSNIFAGDFAKLAGLPWIGYSTGLLASFMLLSYFNAMKEKPSAWVQVVGIGMNLVVLGQLAYVGFMPLAAYAIIAPLAAGGLLLNHLNIRGKAPPRLWKLWERGTALMALASIPPSIALSFGAVLAWSSALTAVVAWTTGGAAFAAGVALIVLDKRGKLPGWLKDVWTSLNAGSATALYTLNPLIGLTWIYLHPNDIAGISATTNVLNMLGAMLLLPRGTYLRKGLWVFGNVWALTVGSWIALLAMTFHGALNITVFGLITAAVVSYLAFILRKNAKEPPPPEQPNP